MNNHTKLFLSLAAVFGLAACGGSGSGSGAPGAAVPSAPVKPLQLMKPSKTGGQSGQSSQAGSTVVTIPNVTNGTVTVPQPATASIDAVDPAHRTQVKQIKTFNDKKMGALLTGFANETGSLTLLEGATGNVELLLPADFNLASLPEGILDYRFANAGASRDSYFTNNPVAPTGHLRAWQMPYSISVFAYTDQNATLGYMVQGLKTEQTDLPKTGSARYEGKAFNAWSEGSFAYDIAFGNDLAHTFGTGKVSGLKGKPGDASYAWGDFILPSANASILPWHNQYAGGNVVGFAGSSPGNGQLTQAGFRVGFFGPKGQELSGSGIATVDGHQVGYGMGGKCTTCP